MNLINKIYLYKKQDIRIYIYVAYSQPKDWTDLAKIFCGHRWLQAKKNAGPFS